MPIAWCRVHTCGHNAGLPLGAGFAGLYFFSSFLSSPAAALRKQLAVAGKPAKVVVVGANKSKATAEAGAPKRQPPLSGAQLGKLRSLFERNNASK